MLISQVFPLHVLPGAYSVIGRLPMPYSLSSCFRMACGSFRRSDVISGKVMLSFSSVSKMMCETNSRAASLSSAGTTLAPAAPAGQFDD